MEEWSRWQPAEGVSGRFYLNRILLSDHNVFIRLSSEARDIKVEMLFDIKAGAYRYTNESFCFGMFGLLDDQGYGNGFYSAWSFFKVKNSDYAAWFFKKLGITSDTSTYTHFCIMTSEEVIDILCVGEPKVTIKNFRMGRISKVMNDLE